MKKKKIEKESELNGIKEFYKTQIDKFQNIMEENEKKLKVQFENSNKGENNEETDKKLLINLQNENSELKFINEKLVISNENEINEMKKYYEDIHRNIIIELKESENEKLLKGKKHEKDLQEMKLKYEQSFLNSNNELNEIFNEKLIKADSELKKREDNHKIEINKLSSSFNEFKTRKEVEIDEIVKNFEKIIENSEKDSKNKDIIIKNLQNEISLTLENFETHNKTENSEIKENVQQEINIINEAFKELEKSHKDLIESYESLKIKEKQDKNEFEIEVNNLRNTVEELRKFIKIKDIEINLLKNKEKKECEILMEEKYIMMEKNQINLISEKKEMDEKYQNKINKLIEQLVKQDHDKDIENLNKKKNSSEIKENEKNFENLQRENENIIINLKNDFKKREKCLIDEHLILVDLLEKEKKILKEKIEDLTISYFKIHFFLFLFN